MTEVESLLERERDYLKLAARSQRLAREAAFFGEDDFYDYLLQQQSYAYLAELCGQEARYLMAEAQPDSSSRTTSTRDLEGAWKDAC